MSQFDELMEKYKSETEGFGKAYDADLMTKVAKGLGPSIYNLDSSLVSSSDPEELKRIDENYLQKKLGLPAGPANMAAIQEVIEIMGSSNRNKYRVVFYYLLCKKFGKESVYA